jgi:hypothetical protein
MKQIPATTEAELTSSWNGPNRCGPFPSLTGEEVVVEDRLLTEEILKGVEAGLAPEKLVGPLKETRDLLQESTTRHKGESFAYGVCIALINASAGNKPGAELGLGTLERSHVLKRMRPEVGFALAIKTVRAGDAKAFTVITNTMKREHPMHPDLSGFKTAEEETLGIMAAKCDETEIIAAIAAQNPDNLEVRGPEDDTVAHTASRFCSWKTIDFLIEKKIELFGKKNLRGETPLDLPGGELIRTKIDLEEIRRAEGASLERKENARTILQAATKRKPGRPLIEIRNGRVRMEVLSAQEPSI